jgi:PAS domain S-box-containing protein
MPASLRLSPSTLLRYERLEGIADRSLEDLTRMAAQILGADRCFAGLVHPDDGWMRTVIGIGTKEAREYAPFCAYAMMHTTPTFIDDARAVDALANVPLVAQKGGIRMFAASPIVTMDGVMRGAFVLLDRKARQLSAKERETFLTLANQVKNQVEINSRIEDLRVKHATQIGALSMLKGLLKAATTFAIIGTDTSGRIMMWSEGAERLLGMSAQDAAALTPIAFLDPREVKIRATQLSTSLARHVHGFTALVAECNSDAPIERTWTMRRADGSTFPGLLVVARVLGEDSAVSGYALIARDITEQRAVDRMKDDFVSMVSHELRTPLTAIRGALGLATGGVAGQVPDGIGELLDIAHSNTARLLRIVNDILDLHRLESGALDLSLGPADVLAIVRRAVDLMSPVAAESGVTVRVTEGAKTETILADFERWVQILVNLVSNAIKYSPGGAVVDIDVTIRDRIVRVSVTDRGPGIPDEFRARIFQKFSQAQTGNIRGGGTGLGLSIVKSLVELHGGKIGFSSEPGKGTTFWVEQIVHDKR